MKLHIKKKVYMWKDKQNIYILTPVSVYCLTVWRSQKTYPLLCEVLKNVK